jgi:hypothetical protein
MATRYVNPWFALHVKLHAPVGTDNIRNYLPSCTKWKPDALVLPSYKSEWKYSGILIREKRQRYLSEQIFLKKFQHDEHNTMK